MMQKAEKKEAIEKVRRVFGEYIKSSPYMELLWSEKLGYVLMSIDERSSEIMESRVVTDAENLCRCLINEIAQKVLEGMEKDRDTYELSSLEHEEFEKELKPYRDQLLEYAHLFENLCGEG